VAHRARAHLASPVLARGCGFAYPHIPFFLMIRCGKSRSTLNSPRAGVGDICPAPLTALRPTQLLFVAANLRWTPRTFLLPRNTAKFIYISISYASFPKISQKHNITNNNLPRLFAGNIPFREPTCVNVGKRKWRAALRNVRL